MESKFTTSSRIFILEDDVWYGSMLEHFLGLNPSNEVYRFETASEMFANLHLKPDLITVDFSLPDLNGDEVLKKIKRASKEIHVIIISGQSEIKKAIAMLQDGAYEYIIKDDDTKERLLKSIQHLNELNGLKNKVEKLEIEVGKKYHFNKVILGKSKEMNNVYDQIDRCIKNNSSIALIGEEGTGKDLISKIIHYNSERRKYPYIKIDIASLPKELQETTLFGYEKGVFDWAKTRKTGRLEEAENGTIFIDKIDQLDFKLQLKLLKTIQNKEITRVGGNTEIPLNVRFIVSTSESLLRDVHNNTFNEDLYLRLIETSIEIPPLRDRNSDVLILAKYFTDSFCKDHKIELKQISREAQNELLNYRFPGNVSELKNMMELIVSLTDGNTIEKSHLNLPSIIENREQYIREKEQQIIQKHFPLKKVNIAEFQKEFTNYSPAEGIKAQSEESLIQKI